jgi:hypothetical protein
MSARHAVGTWGRTAATYIQGIATGRMGQMSPLPDPALLVAHTSRPTQNGLTLPHWPPFEDDTAEHQIRLKPTKERDLELTCTCGASIETRELWADSQARTVWAAWHEARGLLLWPRR